MCTEFKLVKHHLHSEKRITQADTIAIPEIKHKLFHLVVLNYKGEQRVEKYYAVQCRNGYIQVPPSATLWALPLFPSLQLSVTPIVQLPHYSSSGNYTHYPRTQTQFGVLFGDKTFQCQVNTLNLKQRFYIHLSSI